MRKWMFRLGTLLVLVAIAACMMVIGRGHTVYFDNKKLEYEGQELDTYRRINVFVNGEQVAKLSAKDRGMATFTGSSISLSRSVRYSALGMDLPTPRMRCAFSSK